MPDLFTESQKAQKELLDKSSSINRNLGLIFISFLVYVLVTVGSVTDLMLLLPDEKVKMPIIDVELPINSFFLVTPILILGLHLNLLINLYEHRKKLLKWLDTNKESENRTTTDLFPFIFDFSEVKENKNFTYYATRILVRISSLYLPMLLLAYIQLRYSDMHDIFTTDIHFFFFCIDAALVFIFLPLLSSPQLSQTTSKNLYQYYYYGFFNLPFLQPILSLLSEFFKHSKRNFFKRLYQLTSLITPERSVSFLFQWILFWGIVLMSIYYFKITRNISLKDKYETVSIYGLTFQDAWIQFLSVRFQRYPRIIVNDISIIKEAPSNEVLAFYLNKYPNLDDAKLYAQLHFTKGVNLSARNLSFSNFSNSSLINANLKDAKLQQSSFYHSQLQGIKLISTDLSKANLIGANLNGAIITNAKFDKANLIDVSMSDANLKFATFTGVQLDKSVLEKSNFINCKIDGANLAYSQFENTNFHNTKLNGSNLFKAKLSKSTLTNTTLQGCYLEGVDISGTIMKDCKTDAVYYKTLIGDSSVSQFIKSDFESFLAVRKTMICNYDYPIENLLIKNIINNDPNIHIHNEELILTLLEKCPTRLIKFHYFNIISPQNIDPNNYFLDPQKFKKLIQEAQAKN